MFRRPYPNCAMHRRTTTAVSLPATFVRTAITRTPVLVRALTGLDQHVIQVHASTVLAASLLLHSLAAPLLLPSPCSAAVAVPTQIAAEAAGGSPELLANAPDLHAEASDTQTEQQWWQEDAGAWLELTTPAELSAFLNSSQAAPAWPYLEDVQLSPKLRVVEFYATWCPACRAVAAGMAAVAKDPQLQPTCTFARANADRVKPVMKQLGISKIPTALIISPEGHILDSVRASGKVVREAVLQHAAALSKATDGLIPRPPAAAAPPAEIPPLPSPDELSPSEVDGLPLPEEPADSTPAAEASGVTGGSSSSGAGAAGGLTPDQACGPQPAARTNNSSSSSREPLQGVGASSTPVGTAAASASTSAAAAALSSAKQQFVQQYGVEYGYDGWLDQHYQQEVGRRLGAGHHYLDYTGAALYPASLLEAVYSDLLAHTYGNPHSVSAAARPGTTAAGAAARIAPSAASESVLEDAALTLLQHINADPATYQVVFTRSATEALKLVGEMFPWSPAQDSDSTSTTVISSEVQMLQPSTAQTPQQQQQQHVGKSAAVNSPAGSQFIYTRSNHNSVLGIGAYAAAAGAQLVPMTDMQMDQWLRQQQHRQQEVQQQLSTPLQQSLSRTFRPGQQQQDQHLQQTLGVVDSPDDSNSVSTSSSSSSRYHLVAYPAEDNFAGVIYPTDWASKAHALSTWSDRYLVLLDAAAYLPTHTLDLTAQPADFMVASFYKMFGYPTGLGALVLRTDLVTQLNKVYFGGGSVSLATPEGCWHVSKCDPGQALSDGTPNYLGAAALKLAFENWDSRGGMQAVEHHTQALTSWLQQQLMTLKHSNNAPLLRIFGNHHQQQPSQVAQHQAKFPSSFGQGPIFNFQVLKPDGTPLSYLQIEQEASAAGLDLRSGCVCNPGACYDALGLSAEEVQGLAGLKEGCGDDLDVVTVMRPAGLDSSVGSNTADDLLASGASAASAASGQQQELVATEVPLGSVRASLGWASTFEDACALVEFLEGYIV